MSTPSTGSAARPAISVVVPFFEAERYLDETIRSIERQTVPPDDLILVDDGSTDGGPGIARGAASNLTTTRRVLTQPNRGIGAARNAGTVAATGSLVAFCDADDLWEPTKLERQLELLAAQPELGAVLCGVQEFVSPELIGDAASLRPARRLDEAAATSALVVRRDALDEIGPFAEGMALGEWFDWYARLSESRWAVGSVDEILVHRRLHTTNNSLRRRAARSEYLQVLRGHLARTRAES